MHALIRELIDLYVGLLQLHGHVLPAASVRARDATRPREACALEA